MPEMPGTTAHSRPSTFIDLFAGLGGFHLALEERGLKCVFACEKDLALRQLYASNFGITPAGDIRDVQPNEIPDHDILCAGFPCQPFSKAGEQAGFDCPRNGDLFDYVLAVVEAKRPRFILLENVPNLRNHNAGDTFFRLETALRNAGYDVREKKLSPHHFGIPQIRERIFIVAALATLEQFRWPLPQGTKEPSIDALLDILPQDARRLPSQVEECISVWQMFLDHYPREVELPSFPLWAMEWGATYPFENRTPASMSHEELSCYKGSFGADLATVPTEELLAHLPAYARTRQSHFPRWKIRFIEQNRAFFQQHKRWLTHWMPKIQSFPASRQKLEWNVKGGAREIRSYVLQLRASGVRVKRRTTAPSLVAMTSTQVPIIAWEGRYMTPRECARLQSMEGLRLLPTAQDRAFKALGNAVNVEVVRQIVGCILRHSETLASSQCAVILDQANASSIHLDKAS